MTKTFAAAAIASVLLASAAGAADFKPAIIFDLGGKFDKSFNEAAYNGAEKSRPRPASNTSSSRSPTRASATRRCAG